VLTNDTCLIPISFITLKYFIQSLIRGQKSFLSARLINTKTIKLLGEFNFFCDTHNIFCIAFLPFHLQLKGWLMLRTIIKLVVLSGVLLTLPMASWADTIARAQFTSDVVEREPIDELGPTIIVQYGGIQKVYFFTDLRDMEGDQIVHRWTLDGDVMAEIPFNIGGDRWRVWSSKRLLPGFDGIWAVDIIKNGSVVETHSFNYLDQ